MSVNRKISYPMDFSPTVRQLPNEKDAPVAKCVCSRPKAQVYCQKCGYAIDSCRARKSCPSHPKVINLMDLGECPKCRSLDLQERAVN